MTIEMKLLVWTALLTLGLAFVSVLAAMGQVGLATLAGDREGMPELKGLAGRALRTHRNAVENLVLFAIVVLVAKQAGVSNASTVLGAQLFFWGRVAHAGLYLGGVAWLRTAAFAVSTVGLLMIMLQLL